MLKRNLKIGITLVVLIVVSFFSIRYYAYNGGKRDIATEAAVFKVSSKTIVTEFTTSLDASNKKYLEKPVTVSGIVTSIKDKEVILDNSVNCNFLTTNNAIKKNQKITVKGRVVGYDDLLGEVKLDQCDLSSD